MSENNTKLDVPSALSGDEKFVSDPNANFFRHDVNIPTSFVRTETSFQQKNAYEPMAIGVEHDIHKGFFSYDESVSDIGGGFFKITTKYAKVPDTHYTFQAISVPYLKFTGTTVTGSGPIIIVDTFLFGYLNVQAIEDVRNFDEDSYVSTETKQGTVNCVVRVKCEYKEVPFEEITNGTLTPFDIKTADYLEHPQNGNSGNIDNTLTFNFTVSSQSDPIKYESGKYLGNIYYQKTYEIVSEFKI